MPAPESWCSCTKITSVLWAEAEALESAIDHESIELIVTSPPYNLTRSKSYDFLVDMFACSCRVFLPVLPKACMRCPCLLPHALVASSDNLSRADCGSESSSELPLGIVCYADEITLAAKKILATVR